jgi:lipoprotein-releasing system permease protein
MFRLAIRHIITRKSQSILTLIAVLLGSAGYVTFSAMMIGLQERIQNTLVESSGHVTIRVRNDYITEESLKSVFFDGLPVHWIREPSGRRTNAYLIEQTVWQERLKKDDRVLSFAPLIARSVIIKNGFNEINVNIQGIDPDMHTATTNIEEMVKEGSLNDLKGGGAMVLAGKDLLKLLGARLHDTIILTLSDGTTFPARIMGTIVSGNRRLDEATLYASLRTVQQLSGSNGRITAIIVKLKKVEDAAAVATEWAKTAEDKVESWDQANEGFKSIMRTQDVTRLTTLSVLILVIAFGIYNILNMAVSHKKKDIAILRSMGFEQYDVILLFLYQGVILGVIGSVLGLLTGYLGSLYLSTIEIMPGSGGMFISFKSSIYIQSFLLLVGASTLASLFPSWKAGKMKPIQVIREAD